MDAAGDSGLIDKNSPLYADFLSDYWNQQAMRDMGIDPADWDTSKGTEYNWETIRKVYDFYGQAYLSNPDLQWAGMANMIGPSFAGGFKDMAMMRELAQQIADCRRATPRSSTASRTKSSLTTTTTCATTPAGRP